MYISKIDIIISTGNNETGIYYYYYLPLDINFMTAFAVNSILTAAFSAR
jgi:hypothetical protein